MIGLLAALPALAALVLAAWLLAEVLGGVGGGRGETYPARAGSVAVLIPAHDEALVIGATLATLTPQLRGGDTLLVVADNCADETADIARAAGARVAERTSETERGKGYALQHGIEALRAEAPDVLVVIDADCRAGEGLLDRLGAAAMATGRPVQSLNLMAAPEGAGTKARVAEFAWAFINRTRMTGLSRLFGVTRLLGTGMAFPWEIARGLDLRTDEIVEDIALAGELAARGAPPLFVPEALVTSDFPTEDRAATTQRARWEIGSLRLARTTALPLLGRSVTRGRWRAAALAMDLLVPPLTVFAGLVIGLALLGAVLALFGAWLPLAAAMAAGTLFAAAVVIGWAAHGREALPAAALGGLGGYAASKLRVYGAAGRASAKQWTRTERD